MAGVKSHETMFVLVGGAVEYSKRRHTIPPCFSQRILHLVPDENNRLVELNVIFMVYLTSSDLSCYDDKVTQFKENCPFSLPIIKQRQGCFQNQLNQKQNQGNQSTQSPLSNHHTIYFRPLPQWNPVKSRYLNAEIRA